MSDILTTANLRHAASRNWTCAEPEFRLSWIKLCSSDNCYTTAPCISEFGNITVTSLFPVQLLSNTTRTQDVHWTYIRRLRRLLRSSHSEVFYKKAVLRNFTKFTGKHLCQSLFINACNFAKKETLAQVFFCEFCKISKNTFSFRTPLVAAFIFWTPYVSSMASCVQEVVVCILELVAFGYGKTYLTFPSRKPAFSIIYVALKDLFFSF